MKLNLLQFGSFCKRFLWYRQHGWIDPDTNNALWSNSSFSHSRIDKYFGGIVVRHDGGTPQPDEPNLL
jgi:hypothetical protein